MNELFFWICAVGLFHIYLGYPALMWLVAQIRPHPVQKAPYAGSFSVVIAAFNEAERLPEKIGHLLGSESAGQISEIIVGSDGSSDGTVQAVKAIRDARVRVVEFSERRGKPAVLNDLVPQCVSNVVVLTDARQDVAPGALAGLLAHFADDRVGVVSGELVFRGGDATAASAGIGFYWRYEKFIRKQESLFNSVPGATGALYAMRRELFNPIPEVTLLDDVVIPMQAVLQGYRCVFEEEAQVYDTPSQTAGEEFVRKRRTIGGNAQLLKLYPSWLLPWRNPVWFQFVTHKMGRLLSPLFLLGCIISNAVLLHSVAYRISCAAQVFFYSAALMGWLLPHRGVRSKNVFAVPFMFVSLNVVTWLAVWDVIRGRTSVRWRKPASAI